jgi:tetratricopeptide (TPR) repeat protein
MPADGLDPEEGREMDLFHRRTVWVGAMLLALLAATPAAQDGTPPAQSPKALLERGAFAEEHEGDLEAAAKLYRQALEAARSASDEATAAEASAALGRVDVRLGRSQEPAAKLDETDPIANRIGALLADLSKVESTTTFLHSQRLDDLVTFGATAVPWLERALSAQPFTVGAHVVHLEPRRAAAVLARIEAPEAMAALERALSSPDPVVQHAVTGALDSNKHRQLLERAARDEKLRPIAVQKLATLDDADLQPAMERWAEEGFVPAMQWIAKRDAHRLLVLVANPALGPDMRSSAMQALKYCTLPLDEKTVDTLLAWARTGQEDALKLLAYNFAQSGREIPEAMRNRAEAAVLADLGSYPAPEVYGLLGVVGRARSLEALAQIWARERAAGRQPPQALWQAIQTRLDGQVEFGELLALFRELPPHGATPSSGLLGRIASKLASLVDQGAAMPVQFAEGLSGLEGEHRAAYLHALGSWLIQRQRGSWPGGLSPAFLPALRELATSEERAHRAVAAKGFGAVGDLRELEHVLDLLSDPEGAVSQDALYSARVLAHPDPQAAARMVEARLLGGEMAPPDLEQKALQILPGPHSAALFEKLWSRHTDTGRRSGLLRTLILQVREIEVTGLLAKHYRDIPAHEVDSRVIALSRFARDLYEPALPLLGEELRSPDAKVREAAHAAFQEFKRHREALAEFEAWTQTDREARASIQELVTLLSSDQRQVVIGAVKALGVLRARSALPALVKLLEREDPELREAVNEAIARF